jgi:glycosyltransferase involved in cell wall biosynthesis
MLVDVGDVRGIADAMERLVTDPGRFDRVAIREDFMRRFSRPAVVRQLCKIYERVAK